MTPEQEFLRRVELKLQEIRHYINDDNPDVASLRVRQLERMVHEAATK